MIPIKNTDYEALKRSYSKFDSLQTKKMDFVLSKIHNYNYLLDVGSGTGELINRLILRDNSGYNIGLEINKSSFNYLTEKYINEQKVQIFNLAVDTFKHETDLSFDYITLLDILEHNSIDKVRSILMDCYLLLNPGGIIIITTPGILDKFIIGFNSIKGEYGPHVTGLSSFGWKREVKRAGFTIIENRTIEFPFINTNFTNQYLSFFGKCHLIIAKK